MMTNPYRAYPERISSTPSNGCLVCRTRAALAHVNWLRVAAWVVAGALPMISVASAAFAYEQPLPTLNARMIAAAEVLSAATAGKARPPRTPPVPLDPLYSNRPNAASVCASVEREVDRDVLLAALKEDMPQGPRIVPEISNGKVLGLRVFGIRDGSGLSRLGLVKRGPRSPRSMGSRSAVPTRRSTCTSACRRPRTSSSSCLAEGCSATSGITFGQEGPAIPSDEVSGRNPPAGPSLSGAPWRSDLERVIAAPDHGGSGPRDPTRRTRLTAPPLSRARAAARSSRCARLHAAPRGARRAARHRPRAWESPRAA